MSHMDTLFGGIVLIIALYYILRLLGVTNYWRGVVSSALPMLAYVIYAMSDWPGGEVLAMHVAVYVATGTVLAMLGSSKRTGSEPLHWVPKVIIGFFAGLFVIEAVLMSISTSGIPPAVARWVLPRAGQGGVHTAFPGVVPHHEDAAAAVSEHLKEVHRQRELGWHIVLAGLGQLRQGRASDLTVSVTDKAQKPLDGARVDLSLLRPAMAADDHSAIPMMPAAPGTYRARVKLPDPGRWVAVVSVQYGGDRYEIDRNIVVPGAE